MIGFPLASAHTHDASSTATWMCPIRGETATAVWPNTAVMCRFSAQYWIIATLREASGSASGGSMTILAGGCSPPASGIIGEGLQLLPALSAAAVMAHTATAAI